MPVRPGSGHPAQRRGVRRASYALAAYTLITLVMTWPLARGLGRDVAWDLGDSILNMWILAWDAEQFRAILAGHFSHIRTFFDANIFHPAPLTLAYSEHLVPQALQIFPVYALTKNPILCYNLLFLSTFILSGLGMYLFVRELTGNAIAAFVGGLLFAFAPYRIPQSSHLQVLSSQWMPFALYGFRRYFDTGRRRALAGAAGGRHRREPVVRLLPAVLLAVRRGLCAVGNVAARPLARSPHLDRSRNRRGDCLGRHGPVCHSVPARAAGAAALTLVDGSDSLVRGRLCLCHGVGHGAFLGPASR